MAYHLEYEFDYMGSENLRHYYLIASTISAFIYLFQ
jgi:hypothetical protein